MNNKVFIKEKLTQKLFELKEKKRAGGVLIKCIKTDNVFLLLRNDKTPKWSLMSGEIEKEEEVLDGLKREIVEELKTSPDNVEFKFISTEEGTVENMMFYYFEGFTSEEFIPILNNENLKYGWFSKNNLPSPLFEGLAEKIAKI